MGQPSMRLTMPAVGRTSEGPTAGPALDLAERKGPKRADELAVAVDPVDAEAGAWVDASAQAFGDLSAFASQIGVDLSYLGKMRKGQKPLSGAHLVALKGQTEAVLALVAPLLESIGYVARPVAAPTRKQVAEALLSDFDDGSIVTRSFIERAGSKRGWSSAQIALALRNEENEE